jgi:hypothetical protein
MRYAYIAFILTCFFKCQGQPVNHTQDKITIDTEHCDQKVYGTKKYIEKLPSYICIPKGYIIDDFVRTSDFDADGQDDFLAIKYNKKEDEQVDGDTTFWDFYLFDNNNKIFRTEYTLTNITPPFIKYISNTYLADHPETEMLFNKYPLRLAHRLAFIISKDTLRLSYKMDDTYGKSFVFVFSQLNNDWILKEIEYFIGDLPSYWWTDNDFYFPLKDQLKLIEKRIPNKNISLKEMDLAEAFQNRVEESTHLANFHINTLDESKYNTILEVCFKRCQEMHLPKEWPY